MTLLSRMLSAVALAVPALLAGAAGTHDPAGAAPAAPVVYDALGDSYASGYGVGPYRPCGQSDAAYAFRVDGRMRIALDDFVACAGATVSSLIAGGQLDALDASTDLVSISIGGNDIGWSSAMRACLAGTDDQCGDMIETIRGLIQDQLPDRLDGLYEQISTAAPNAHVLVLGYPRLLSPEYGAFLGASVHEQQELNDGADLLDGVIRSAARAHGFDFVDVRKRFEGHGVNAPQSWLTGPFDAAALHPNADGWAAYASAVTAAYKPGQVR